MEGESPLFRRGGSLPPNLPLSPRTSPISPPFRKRRFDSLFVVAGIWGKFFVFGEVRIFCRVRLSHSFCGWNLGTRLGYHHPERLLPANRVRSRTLQSPCTSQSDKKTSPKSTRKKQSEPNLRNAKAGALGGSSREVREVWRVGTPLRKRGSCASKVFPCSHQQFFTEKT